MNGPSGIVQRRVLRAAAAVVVVAGVLLLDTSPAAVLIVAPALVIGPVAATRLPPRDAVIAAAIASVPGALAYAILTVLDPQGENDIGYGLLFGLACLLSIIVASGFVVLRGPRSQR